MHHFILLDFSWTQLLQPQWYIENGGLWLLLFVVFAETGLFVGFFLPGDSLLFVAGMYAHEIKGIPGLAYQFLKLLGIRWALSLGIQEMFTNNDAVNTPMVAVNEKFGFERRPSLIRFAKNLLGAS